MTDGMMTRSRAIEEQLAVISEQLASFGATVQQHTDTFETVQKHLTSQQTVMADILVKLAKLDKPTPTPPLLPLPPSAAMVTIPPMTDTSTRPPLTGTVTTVRLPKLEIPLFSGDDVLNWLLQIELFFSYHQVPVDQKLIIAAFYMTGPALQWYHWLQNTAQLSTWEVFSRQAELRFGPSTFINHEAQLYKLKQKSTVTSYLTEFESLSTRVTGLSQSNLLNCFLSGLRDDIQYELYLLKPQDLHDAMGMARLVEDKCNFSRAPPPRWTMP